MRLLRSEHGRLRRAPFVLAATFAAVAGVLKYQAPAPTVPAAVSSGSSTARVSGKQVDGDVVATRYGDVQVRITVSGGKVVDVTPLALPQSDGRSVQISTTAAPLLRQEVLSAQSGNVDGVSGATYTSQGYEQSAASAIAKAGIT
ncbi:MAG TPA: FMN-binding protein [Solirubrobacteraceae bacterium]|jgi:uncharacterized protein with FMN-binding domain